MGPATAGGLQKSRSRKSAIYRVTIVGMVVNPGLTLGKLAAGILGRSRAMVAEPAGGSWTRRRPSW